MTRFTKPGNLPQRLFAALFLALLCGCPTTSFAESGIAPSAAATSAFDRYLRSVETSSQLPGAHLTSADAQHIHSGEILLDRVTPPEGLTVPGAMIHHWRATAFVPAAHAADFVRLIQNFPAYPTIFAPQVLRTSVIEASTDHARILMRVRQKHILTVVMDATYDVTFAPGRSTSRSTHIAEIASPGTPDERPLTAADEHGFLWRQNTYWTYEQQDGGLLLHIESVSLSRAIPHGLAWAVGPFVESVPKESLQFTLRSVCNALKK